MTRPEFLAEWVVDQDSRSGEILVLATVEAAVYWHPLARAWYWEVRRRALRSGGVVGVIIAGGAEKTVVRAQWAAEQYLIEQELN